MRLGKEILRNPARNPHRAALCGVGFVGLEMRFLGVAPPHRSLQNQANPDTKKLRYPNQVAQASNALPATRIKHTADRIAQIQLPQQKFLFE